MEPGFRERATTPGDYIIGGQPSAPVGGQTVVSTPQRQLNGQFVDPAATANQSVAYERQDYVNGYQQQVRVSDRVMGDLKISRSIFLHTTHTRISRNIGFFVGCDDGAASTDNANEPQQLGTHGHHSTTAAATRRLAAATATAATSCRRHAGERIRHDRRQQRVGKRDAWVSTSTGPAEFTQL